MVSCFSVLFPHSNSEDVCVLSATGTAAIINMGYNRSISQNDIFNINKPTGGTTAMSVSLEERNVNSDVASKEIITGMTNGLAGKRYGLPSILNASKTCCTICHVPYNVSSVPFNVKLKKCAICLKGRVPDVLLATLEVPESVQVTGEITQLMHLLFCYFNKNLKSRPRMLSASSSCKGQEGFTFGTECKRNLRWPALFGVRTA